MACQPLRYNAFHPTCWNSVLFMLPRWTHARNCACIDPPGDQSTCCCWTIVPLPSSFFGLENTVRYGLLEVYSTRHSHTVQCTTVTAQLCQRPDRVGRRCTMTEPFDGSCSRLCSVLVAYSLHKFSFKCDNTAYNTQILVQVPQWNRSSTSLKIPFFEWCDDKNVVTDPRCQKTVEYTGPVLLQLVLRMLRRVLQPFGESLLTGTDIFVHHPVISHDDLVGAWTDEGIINRTSLRAMILKHTLSCKRRAEVNGCRQSPTNFHHAT